MLRKTKVCPDPAAKENDEPSSERKEIRERLSSVEAKVEELSDDLEEVKEKIDNND
jgi:flagellar motility protein MotE (MotC chaperone)